MDPALMQMASIVQTQTHDVSNLPASTKSDCVLILRNLTIIVEINAKR